MNSIVSICNKALRRIGNGSTIEEITEASTEARVCLEFYDLARRSLMREAEWNFTTRTATLATVNVTPDDGDYEYVFQLPVKCLKLLKFIAPEAALKDLEYEIRESKYLYTDEETVVVKYVYDEEDPTKFDDLFLSTLAWKLAFEIALPLSASEAVSNRCYQAYQIELVKANAANRQENQVPLTKDTSLIDARR
jgi:hypothetical protein